MAEWQDPEEETVLGSMIDWLGARRYVVGTIVAAVTVTIFLAARFVQN